MPKPEILLGDVGHEYEVAARIQFDAAATAAVGSALVDWLPQMAQYLLDEANAFIGKSTAWAALDDFATRCEQLAMAARTAALLAQASP